MEITLADAIEVAERDVMVYGAGLYVMFDPKTKGYYVTECYKVTTHDAALYAFACVVRGYPTARVMKLTPTIATL